ncbi:endothelin-1 [Rhinophrynus dorsalis]
MDLQMILYLLMVFIQGAIGTESESTKPVPEKESSAPAPEAASHHNSGAPWRPRRFKRCSCSSLMDKECVYFCHLDIIWINTPERTVPYGLGGPRMRRALQDSDTEKLPESTSRCICAKSKDKKCLNFCQTAAELSVQSSLEKERSQVQQAKDCSGLRLGQQCIQKQLYRHKSKKRLETIEHSLKSSFAFAKLMKKLNDMKDMSDHWTHKKRGVWKHMKTTS